MRETAGQRLAPEEALRTALLRPKRNVLLRRREPGGHRVAAAPRALCGHSSRSREPTALRHGPMALSQRPDSPGTASTLCVAAWTPEEGLVVGVTGDTLPDLLWSEGGSWHSRSLLAMSKGMSDESAGFGLAFNATGYPASASVVYRTCRLRFLAGCGRCSIRPCLSPASTTLCAYRAQVARTPRCR